MLRRQCSPIVGGRRLGVAAFAELSAPPSPFRARRVQKNINGRPSARDDAGVEGEEEGDVAEPENDARKPSRRDRLIQVRTERIT